MFNIITVEYKTLVAPSVDIIITVECQKMVQRGGTVNIITAVCQMNFVHTTKSTFNIITDECETVLQRGDKPNIFIVVNSKK